MSKPHKKPKPRVKAMELQPELAQELELLMDRLKVQHPNGASLDSYLQSLRGSLAGKEPLAVALLERLGRHPGEVGYRVLRSLGELFPSKLFRTVYRQTEYRFRQAGYGAEAEVTSSVATVLVPGEVKKPVAHMSPLSPDGHWFVSALVPDEQQVRTLVFALIGFPFHCEELRTMPSSFGDYREFQKELARNFTRPYVEIPVVQAARTVFDLFASDPAASDPAASGHRETANVTRLLRPFHDPQRQLYADDLLPPATGFDLGVSDAEAKVVIQELPVNALTFARVELQPFWESIQALEHSVLVVAPGIKEERVEAIITDAADRLCSVAKRQALERFFVEQALYFHLLGSADLAMTLWKTAQLLRSGEPASHSPVIVKLISASFYFHWQSEFEAAPARAEEPKADPTYRTESGLILLR